MRFKPFTICLLLLYLLMGGTTAFAADHLPAFHDLRDSFAKDQINRLSALGIVEEISVGEFKPNEVITRLQFSVWLAKTLGIEPSFSSDFFYGDTKPGSLSSAYLESLAKLDIIAGTSDNLFMPEGPLLRQDAAVILHRALGDVSKLLPSPAAYSDQDLISPYATNGVAYVTTKGWMNGNDQSFRPLQAVTRAEAASLLSKVLDGRNSQALTVLSSVSSQERSLHLGETIKINPDVAKTKPSFTAAYGTDHPEICSVSPDGTITGVQPGEATITVNVGYNSYTIKAKVSSSPKKTGDKDGNKETNEPQKSVDEPGLDLSYAISQHAPDTAFQQTEHNNPGPPEGLTSSSDTWTGFLRQQGRDIQVDLQTIQPITAVSLEFLQKPSWGVWFPEFLKAEVSVDGIAWQHLGHACLGSVLTHQDSQTADLTLVFSPVHARYLKLSFPVDIWAFARHLSVRSAAATAMPTVFPPSRLKSKNLNSDTQNQTIHDVLLIYTGDDSIHQRLNKFDFTPLLAYQDRNGTIKGRMFDTLLFLPYYGLPVTRESWTAYLEDLFTPEKNLHALDEAMDWVNAYSEMKIREKIILTIPYPDVSQKDFGILEENPAPLNFSEESIGVEKSGQNRFAAIRWYYDQMMDHWENANFKNIDLVGMYWYGESIERNTGEKDLVLNTARMVRNNQLDFLWIPYFGVKGYENWRSYGFSQVFLQPNYFAQNSPPEDRMDKAAELARKYNLGIEIECDEAVISNDGFYNLFYNQLKKGHQLGFDGSMANAYYVGHVRKTLLQSARSQEPKIRNIYDDLYRWINGTYR